MTEHDPCEICGNPVERRENERDHDFTSRKTCSPKCRAALIARKADAAGNSQKHWTRQLQPWPRDLWYGE